VPRARLATAEGQTTEWKSTVLRAYQRRTKRSDSLIAGAYLAGTNTRRVRRALSAVFGGAVSKDTVSRVWRKVKGDWDGIVNLTGCGQRDAHREAACANDYAAVITLLISAQTRNVCVLEALCSAAVR
jgi:hypothetical protein